ncbi:hypothetical protein LCGC14_2803450, partial [marine sediment metagenome]
MIVILKNRDINVGLILLQEFMQRELPISLSYAMAKTIRKMKRFAELIEEKRQKLVVKHQQFDADDSPIRTDNGDIKLEDPTAFISDIEKLMNQTNEVDVYQIKLSKLLGLKDGKGKVIRPSIQEIDGLLLLSMI